MSEQVNNTPVNKTFSQQLQQSLEDNGLSKRFIELTDENTFKTELSFALQHFDKNPALKKSTLKSNLMAILNIAHIGLTLNPVQKLAYLVPRWSPNGQETHLEVSYMGLCKLVTDTGSAKRIYSHPVYDGDEFEVSLGMEMTLTHKPKFKTKNITHVYSIAVLHDGAHMIEVMTKEDIDDIRERSESYKAFKKGNIKSCVWESDYSEMARKTVIRRAIKQIPKTDMWERVGEAVALDETDYKASEGQIQFIETLLINANLDHEEQASIYRELPTVSAIRAAEIVEYLKSNQLDPIASGNSYNMTDINNKITNEITPEQRSTNN